MTRRGLTWLIAVLLAVPLVLLSAAGLLAGTEAGTRWLLRTAAPHLPAALEIGDVRGTLLGGLTLARVAWDDELLTADARDVELDAELLPLLDRQVRISRLAAASVSVTVRRRSSPPVSSDRPSFAVNLPVDLYIDEAAIDDIGVATPGWSRRMDRIEFSGNLDGDRLVVRRLAADSDWLGLSARGSARLGGAWAVDAEASWHFAAGDAASLSGRIEVDGDRRQYRLVHELIAPVAVTSRGSLRTDGDAPSADLEHRWQAIEHSVGGVELQSSGGSMTTRGTLQDFDLSLSTGITVDDWPSAEVELDARADLNGAEIESLTVAAAPGRIAVAGLAEWAGVPELDVTFTASELDTALLWPQLVGSVQASGSATGRFPPEAVELDVRIDALEGEINGRPVGGSGIARLADDRLTLTDVSLALGDNRLRGGGSVGDELDLAATLELDALDQLSARAAGAIRADLRLSGTRDDPSAQVELDGERAAWDGISAARVSGTASLSSAASVAVELGADELSVGGLSIDRTRIRLDGDDRAHRFGAELSDPSGSLSLEGEGSLGAGSWQGRLARLDIATEALGNWTLSETVEASVSSTAIELSRFCLASRSTAGRACMAADLGRDTGGALSGEIRRLPLAALPLPLPAGAELLGFVEADFDAVLRDGSVEAGADLRLAEASVEARYEDEPYSLQVTTARARLDVESNRLESRFEIDLDGGAGIADGTLLVTDVLDRGSAIEGSGRVAVPDAALLAVFVPDVADPAGRIEGSMAVAGSLDAPEFTGTVRLEDGRFGVRFAGIEVTDVDLSLSQMDAGRLMLRGSAASGDGFVAIDGQTLISAETGLRAEMRVTGENFQLARLPDWQIAASPDIRLVLDERAASVDGTLTVPDADITLESVPETATRPSPDVVVHGRDEAGPQRGRRIDVDVDVRLGDEVRLSGFGLSTDIEGAVRIEGGSERIYTGNGRLSLSDGRYKAYGQNLEIESGELIFNGPLDNPQLDVRAVRRIDAADVVAGIRLTGTPRRLSSEVYSEPPMAEAEALAYLLTGRPLGGATDAGDADLLNQAAFALGLSQAGSVASQIQGDLGLDTLKVEGGAQSGRIVAGKRFGDRLLVEYGYGLIDKLGTLLLRYQLTNRLVLESRTGAVSELDLVYTVREQ